MTDFNDIHQEQGPKAVKDAINAAEPVGETISEAVARLSALPALEYEKIRKAEAGKLGIDRVSVLDKEVENARSPAQAQNGATEMFPAIEPHNEAVNGATLLDEIADTIRRFIVCDPETVTAASLWIAFTWLIDRVQVAPIAMITAPEMQCGKTQLLTLIGKLANRPLLASNISPAAIFRVIEAHNPTLLIDEADSFLRESEEARGIINSGHTRQSAHVIRVVGDDHEPKQFSTWGAKVICGIGKQAPTLMGRSVILELRRKLSHEKVERLRHADARQFDILKSKLARFAGDVGAIIETLRPALPEALNDRAQDNWEPLLAIADHASGHWPETARSAALKISGKEQDEDNASAGVMLLFDIQDIFESEKSRQKISTEELLKKLHEMEDRPWPEWYRGQPITARQIARHLKPYGIAPKKLRFGYDTGRGYELDQFKDAFDRYLSGTAEQSNKNSGLSENLYGTPGTNVPDENNANALKNKECSAVPDTAPDPEEIEERLAIQQFDGGMP